MRTTFLNMKNRYNFLQTLLIIIQYILIKTGQLPVMILKKTARIFLRIFIDIQKKYKEVLKFKPANLYKKHLHKITKPKKEKKQKRKFSFSFSKINMPVLKLPSLKFLKISFNFKKKGGRPKKKFPIFITKRRVASALLVTFLLISAYTWSIVKLATQIPSPSNLSQNTRPLTTEVYDRNGKFLYRIFDDKNRIFIKLSDLPKDLINATIAVEDKNFYSHLGVDLGAILRAAYHNYKTGSAEGASTLTQQLIKNTLLSSEKTYTRKIKEVILAFLAERIYSKDQILEMYFNNSPYGGPLWGIKAASQTYFGKEPKDLTLGEIAFLTGLPASPTEFSPYGTSPELGTERQKLVLKRMVEEKYITEEQANKATLQKLAFKPQINEIYAPHFVFYIKDYLTKKYGPRIVSEGGLKVTTTLDLDLQKQVEKIVKDEVNNLSSLNVKNGAAMITDPKTGQILAMVGSKDYFDPDFGNYNVALALRQPGSSIKPVTYATAFKKGFSPGNTILDIPTTFKNAWETYRPVNYDGKFHGPVSMRVALASSLNIPAVKTQSTVGLDAMLQTAKDMGITTFTEPDRYGLSLTLGGAEVKMIDMMAVYGTFASEGLYHQPNPILKITDSNGTVLEEFSDQSRQVLDPGIAYLINDILSDNNARTMAFGPNSLLNLSPDVVSVKTGTTDSKRDNWTFGFTPDFVVGVWVGNPDNSPMNPRLSSGITGAAPIWNRITKIMLEKNPSLGFKKPEDITSTLVDGRQDLVIAGSTPKSLSRISKKDDKVVFSDAFSSLATDSGQTAVTEGEKKQIPN